MNQMFQVEARGKKPSKCVNSDPKSLKSRFPLFGSPENQRIPAGGQCQPARQQVLSNNGTLFAICGCASGQIFETIMVLARQGPYTVPESANKAVASAASPDYVKFQAVIKSAASAASPKAKSRKPRPRGAPRGRHPPAGPSPWRSPGSWFL